MQRVKNLLKIPRLVKSLRSVPESPEGLVDFIMAAPVISPYQIKAELLQFARMVAELKPQRVLEIGTCRGGTLFLLARLSAPNSTIISVDLPGGPFGGGYDFIRSLIFRSFTRDGQKLHLIRGDSHRPETKDRVSKLMDGGQFDLLFIDGDHSYDGVSKDFLMYGPLVRSGGIIAFHDIAVHSNPACEVREFWSEIHTPDDLEMIASPPQGWGGIGVTYR